MCELCLQSKCLQQVCAGEHRRGAAVSRCQPRHACRDVRICWLSLSWAFSDVTSPSMDPEGKPPPLRGHEKGTGRLSQHSALAWGLLKAQIHILPSFIFLFLFPLSLSVPPRLPLLKHHPAHMGRATVEGYLYFSPP